MGGGGVREMGERETGDTPTPIASPHFISSPVPVRPYHPLSESQRTKWQVMANSS